MALISTADAKAYLRVSGSSEDSLIDGLVASIATHFETTYGVVIGQENRSWTFDQFQQLMVLTHTPVSAEGLAITYLDPTGAEQTVAEFRSVLLGRHRRILPAIGAAWPATAFAPGVVTVTGQAGWADAQVPADIVVAGKLALSRWYDNRDAELPKAACELLEPYRLRRV